MRRDALLCVVMRPHVLLCVVMRCDAEECVVMWCEAEECVVMRCDACDCIVMYFDAVAECISSRVTYIIVKLRSDPILHARKCCRFKILSKCCVMRNDATNDKCIVIR